MADISKIKLPNGSEYNLKDSGAIRKYTAGNTQELSRPSCLQGLNDNTLDAKINTLRANRLAFLPADQIIIEKTTDGGTTWVDAGVSDAIKTGIFSETRPSVSLPLLNGVKSLMCGLRITITAMKYNVPDGTAETQKYNYWNSNYIKSTERYNQLKEMYFWINAVRDTIGVKVERATGAKPNEWSVIFQNNSWGMTGWSGCDYVRFTQSNFGGGTTQTTNYWNYRLTFMTLGVNGTSTMDTAYAAAPQGIMEIRGYGDTWWTKGNEYAANDKIYTHDSDQNVTFPAQVTATQFNGNLTGSAATVNGHTVNKDVPSDAVFTDTTYTPASANPLMDGTVAVGTSVKYAREDHRHPTDTSRAPKSHASTATTYGIGTNNNYGHVKLSDTISGTAAAASGGTAATPKAVSDAKTSATNHVILSTTQPTNQAAGDYWFKLEEHITSDYQEVANTYGGNTAYISSAVQEG